MCAVATSGIHVSFGVELHAVSHTGIHIRKHAAVRERLCLDIDIKRVTAIASI